MNYRLENSENKDQNSGSGMRAILKLMQILGGERKNLIVALVTMLIHSVLTLTGPALIGFAIDSYVKNGQYKGLLTVSAMLLGIYLVALVTSYLQTKLMGTVGQRMLFNLRNAVFTKLQNLPVAFFNENKAGDLISRINNDTDKLNQFFSQSLMQFVGSIFIMSGAAIFLLVIHFKLGSAALLPAVAIALFTRLLSPHVKKTNASGMKSLGDLSSEIQESLQNFKVVIAFDRRDYFRQKFELANTRNYIASRKAALANTLFMPVYTFFSHIGQLVILAFGLYLIIQENFTIGFLISFLSYINSFYAPLRQLAALWTSFQVALAAWDRISHILRLESNIVPEKESAEGCSGMLAELRHVSFTYPNGTPVLNNISFSLEKGKTYALVGPTGGGKTTTASLMARLYDPGRGKVFLHDKDLKSYSPDDLSVRVGYILQEPFLFTGTVKDNLLYGNDLCVGMDNETLGKILEERGLDCLLQRFENGLEAVVNNEGESLSLGQKQLIAFIRAVLRQPELLILDEATANIDTMTEKQLEAVLRKLPVSTTRIIIAHRLNTIENADEIFFVNSGRIVKAGSMENAMHMLMNEQQNC